jgi:hypothetical protein
LQYLQQEVGLFVQEALRIRAIIMCKHFQPETLVSRSQIQFTAGNEQFIGPAVKLLKDEQLLRYRIKVASDTMSLPDYNAERDSRVEFLTTLGQFLSQAQPMIAAMPQTLPYMVKIIQWVAAGFRSSDQIEGVLDQAAQSLETNGVPPMQQQGGSNEHDAAIAQAGVQQEQAKGQAAAQSEAAKQQTARVQAQAKNQTAAVAGQAKAQTAAAVDHSKGQLAVVQGLASRLHPQPPTTGRPQ